MDSENIDTFKFDLIFKTFRLSGLSIDTQGSRELSSFLDTESDQSSHAVTLKRIVQIILNMELATTFMTNEIVLDAIRIHRREAYSCRGDILKVYDAQTIPLYKFDHESRKYLRKEKLVDGRTDDDRSEMFGQRLSILRNRIERHVIWDEKRRKDRGSVPFELVKVEAVQSKGCSGEDENSKSLILIGCLINNGKRKYAIEDETGVLEMEGFDEAEIHAGFYCENSIIIVEGVYVNDCLKLTSVGLPAPETIAMARNICGHINFLSDQETVPVWSDERLITLKKKSSASMVMFISDLRLDIDEVLVKLEVILEKCSETEETLPAAIVLMGDFIDPQKKKSDRLQAFKDCMDKLWDCLVKHEKLYAECRIVIVPGPNDPGPPANIFPRFPNATIPSSSAKKEIPGCNGPELVLYSNPLWLTFCSETIVVFRYDLTEALLRNSIYRSKSGDDSGLSRDIVRTVLSQSHLLPLPQQLQNGPKAVVVPSFDHTLRLYPCVPDLVVLADKSSSFICDPSADEDLKEKLPLIANPGPFHANQFQFITYFPSAGKVEVCQACVE